MANTLPILITVALLVARDVHVGIACGKGRRIIFRRGEKVRTVREAEFLTALMAEVEAL